MDQSQSARHVSILALAKKATAAIVLLATGVVGGWLLSAFVYPGHGVSLALTQRGEREIVYGGLGWEIVDIYYPRPYRSKPDLTVTPGVTIQEQRPDGFRVFMKKEVTSTLVWTARGMPDH